MDKSVTCGSGAAGSRPSACIYSPPHSHRGVIPSVKSGGKVLATEYSRLLLATVLRIHRLIVQTVKLPLFFLLCHQIF